MFLLMEQESLETGEKVYFKQKQGGDIKILYRSSSNLTEEISQLNLPSDETQEILDFISKTDKIKEQEFLEYDTENYHIEDCDGEIMIQEIYKYDIFRLPADIMSEI